MIGLLKSVLGIAGAIASYVERKQLMDAGEAKAIQAQIKGTLNAVNRAMAAKRGVSHDADSVRNDQDNRDND